MKRWRIVIIIGAICSILLQMDRIYSSTIFFHNMYEDLLPYDINVYSQLISALLLMSILVMILIKKGSPVYLMIVGAVMVLLNTGALIIYVTRVEDFYINLFIIQGIVLGLIGYFLYTNQFTQARRLSLYFFVEFLILQVASLSEESIFYINKTFEANLLGAVLLFVLGILIPVSMSQFLLGETEYTEGSTPKPIAIESLIRIGSLVSIGVLILLVFLQVPLLFSILVDADRSTILFYRMSAVVRIVPYTLGISGFQSILTKKPRTFFVPVLVAFIIIGAFFPYLRDLSYHLERLDNFYVLFIDVFVLIILAVTIELQRYKISFVLSLWFILNILLQPIHPGNIQFALIFRYVVYFDALWIYIRILYYAIPITISLILYQKMQRETTLQQDQLEGEL